MQGFEKGENNIHRVWPSWRSQILLSRTSLVEKPWTTAPQLPPTCFAEAPLHQSCELLFLCCHVTSQAPHCPCNLGNWWPDTKRQIKVAKCEVTVWIPYSEPLGFVAAPVGAQCQRNRVNRGTCILCLRIPHWGRQATAQVCRGGCVDINCTSNSEGMMVYTELLRSTWYWTSQTWSHCDIKVRWTC